MARTHPAIVLLAVLTASQAAMAGLRLPGGAVPLEQEVRLDLDPAEDDYTGSIRASIEVRETGKTIRLHAKGPVVQSATLRAKTGGPVTLAPSVEGDDVLVLSAERPIEPGRYTLEISFKNAFNTKADSLYRVVAGGEPYLFTQFEDTAAREAFPCWDEPSFKIPWRLTLTVPTSALALANTPIESESIDGARRTVVFKKTPPLPAYLVALAVGPFETVPVSGTGIPTRIVTVKGKGGLTAEAVRQTPPLLAALERYFAKPYPFEKLDLIAVPDYWYGAMENPGAITFRDTILLLDPGGSDAEDREKLAGVIAHELAHMWFGDLVTMAWWDDMWLNESFASWMGDKVVQEVFPELGAGNSQVRAMQRAMTFDGRKTTRAMREPVESQEVLLEAADTLAYNKGEAVLGMFEQWLGAETFRNGVIAYLGAHAWGNAKGADLWNALSKAAKKDVGSAMSTFLDQPGVPIVSLEPAGPGKVRLSQRRFAQDGSAPPSKELWKIPVTLAFERDGKRGTKSLLLDVETTTVDLGTPAPEWVYPNADERGYFRWSLPSASLARLSGGTASRLTTRERIGMIGNLGAIFESGGLPAADYLGSLRRFGADEDAQVLSTVLGALDALEGPFGDRTARPALAAFVRATLRPAWERIGPLPRAGEPETVALVRPYLHETLGILGEDPRIAAEARETTARYLADPGSVPTPLALRSLGIAARTGNAALWESFRKRFETASVPDERQAFLEALGMFRDPAIVEKSLAYALEGPLSSPEIFVIPREFEGEPDLESRGYAWTKEHYTEITKRIPPWGAALLPYAAAGCSLDRIADARIFFADPEKAPPGTSKSLEKVAEEAAACVRLRERSRADFLAYLSNPGAASSAPAARSQP